MEYKTFPALGTKVIDEEQGIVEHVITVFGVLDKVKDIAHPGCWTKTIRERSDEFLVLDMHKTDSVMRALGTPRRVWEVARHELPPEVLNEHPEATGGVKAETQFLLETPEGKGAFVRLREKAISKWSYGYDALDVDFSTVKDEDGADVRVRNLRTVKVYEYGPVLWGAVPGTMVTGVKADAGGADGEPDEAKPAPEEAKPAPDVTENTIRVRVRDPGGFQDDSFRTITVGDEGGGIQAVIGRLKGETSTTIQSYIFDKDKWTVDRAQAWVRDHEKSLDKQMTESDGAGALVPVEEKPYLCECLKCGHTIASAEHCRDVKCPECGGEMRRAERPGPGKEDEGMDEDEKGVTGAAGLPLADRARAWDANAANARVRQWASATDAPNTKYRRAFFWYDADNADNFTAYKLQFADVVDGELRAIPRGIFAVAGVLQGSRGGVDIPAPDQAAIKTKAAAYYARMRREFDDDSIVPPWEKSDEGASEEKVGRVLSQRNADILIGAVTTIADVLERAGYDVPGYGREKPKPKPEEEEEEEPEETKPKKGKAADVTADETANTDGMTTATTPPEYQTDADTAPAEQAAQETAGEAGPDDGPPTSDMLKAIQRELAEIGIVEVEDGLQGEARTEQATV